MVRLAKIDISIFENSEFVPTKLVTFPTNFLEKLKISWKNSMRENCEKVTKTVKKIYCKSIS